VEKLADASAGPVGRFAARAVPVDASQLKDDLRLLVEAPRTEIVHRLWVAWVLGPSRLWRDVGAIDEYPGGEFEKRVSLAVRSSFVQFSNSLSQARMLLLELHERGVADEDLRLQIEQFLSHVGHCGTGLSEVPHLQGGFCNPHRGGDATQGSGDE